LVPLAPNQHLLFDGSQNMFMLERNLTPVTQIEKSSLQFKACAALGFSVQKAIKHEWAREEGGETKTQAKGGRGRPKKKAVQ